MSVYVDPLFRTPMTRRWRYAHASHLVADSIPELHEFAESIGLKRCWFQTPATRPHYDLSPNKRREAVLAGARQVSARTVVGVLRRWRGEETEPHAGPAGEADRG